MPLEARQNAPKASAERPNKVGFRSRWAKTMPTKIARFLVHWRGRMAKSNAYRRPVTRTRGVSGERVSGEDTILLFRRFTRFACFSLQCLGYARRFTKKSSPCEQEDTTLPPSETIWIFRQ